MLNSDSFVYKDERFYKLSDKISFLQNLELNTNNPMKISNLETRIEYLEEKVLKTIKDNEFKFKFIQDEINYLNKLVIDDKNCKETIKNKIATELINYEKKIKISFEKERENMKILADNIISVIESQVLNIQIELNKEKEEIDTSINNLRNIIVNDFPNLNESIEKSSEDRNLQIHNVITSIKEELKYLNNLVWINFLIYIYRRS